MAGVFLLLVAVGLVGSVSCQAQCPDQMDAEVLILGAGMAGLGAAEELSKSGVDDFLIIEMRDDIGGRVQTARFGGGNVELGPQWALRLDFSAPEDMQNPLIPLIQRCNITLREVPFLGRGLINYNSRGENITAEFGAASARYLTVALQTENAQNIFGALEDGADLPFTQALRIGGWNARTQLEEHVEFIFADWVFGISTEFSSFWDNYDPEISLIRQTHFGSNTANFIVTDPEGFIAIPRCLAEEYLSENDPRLILGTTIVEISTTDECVCAITSDERRYCAPYAISTFGVAVYQNELVRFTPELPFIKRFTLNKFEMANFLKIFISFNDTFWDTDVDLITHLNERRDREHYPVFAPWGAYFPERFPVIQAFLSGAEAKRVAYQDIAITKQEIGEIMQNIYGERASEPVDIVMHDFIVNPYFYGDFAAATTGIGRRHYEEISAPYKNLYFSSEAFDMIEHSTVHGPLMHGRETAARIAEILRGPIQVNFVNDTPRVGAGSVSAEFRTTKSPTSLECVVDFMTRQDCSSGSVTFTGLAEGKYQFRVVARVEGDDGVVTERGIASSVVTVTRGAACAAHLINRGVSVSGRRAVVEFSSSGEAAVSEFLCSLDGAPQETCTSPVVLRDQSPGRHRLRIAPVCDGTSTRAVARFDIA